LEKRKFHRFTVENNEINIKLPFANLVEVMNISLGGIALKADRRLTIGSIHPLKIQTPEKVSPAKGTIIWSSLIESREDAKGNIVPIYKAGLQFTDIPGETMNEIFRYIELKKNKIREQKKSNYIHIGLEDLDLQKTEKEKIETTIDSLSFK
jgi:c-di-GMP-binding flagellar brake protein YcgR